MNDLGRPLKLKDGFSNEIWKESSIKLPNIDEDNIFDIIESVSATPYEICFILTTKAYLPVEINIPLFSSKKCEINIFVNAKKIKTVEIATVIGTKASPTKEDIVYINENITRWTEPQKETEIKLQVVPANKQKLVIILDSHKSESSNEQTETVEFPTTKESASIFVQKWDYAYAFKAVLIFGLINLDVIVIVALIAAHFRWISVSFQYYAFLVAAVSSVFGILGLTDYLKIPFQQKIRNLYAKTYDKRLIYLSVLGFLSLIIFIYAGFVAYSIGMRLTYKSLIEKALADTTNSELPIKAFRIIPWRIEAPAIIEAQIRSERNSDMNRYRARVNSFTSDSDNRKAIDKTSKTKDFPFYLVKNNSDINIPAVWFSGLIMEGNVTNPKLAIEQARAILSDLTGRIALIQSQILDINELETDLITAIKNKDTASEELLYQKLSAAIGNLENLVKEIEDTGSLAEINSFYYQWACDIIATSYLRLCQNSAYNSEQCSQKISAYFLKEISARANAVTHHNTLWIRPPDKLVLYQLFTVDTTLNAGNRSEVAVKVTQTTKERLKYCFCRENENWDNESCYNDNIKKTILNEFKGFQEQSAWLKGSSTFENGEDLKKRIEKLLEEGWRY